MTVTILGERYEIQTELGKRQNTGRRTLLVRDLQTQALVVVKVLSFNNDFCWEDLKLFEREAQTIAALSHPAIPRYLDYFEINQPDWQGFALVQNYIPAKSLQEHLQAGRTFTEVEVKQIAKSLLEVLIYLHSRLPAVIHRDIKPSNILLANRSAHNVGDVYLVDFGSVQTAVKEYGTRTVVGTYGYMPPELFGGRAFPASDLYGLGATLIYIVTGKHPAELLQDDLQIEFTQQVFSPKFTAWLKWMTSPSLNRRLGSAQAALEALENPNLVNLENLSPRNVLSQKLQKPANSKIKLTKTAEKLEISFPQGEVWRVIVNILSATFISLLILFFLHPLVALGIYIITSIHPLLAVVMLIFTSGALGLFSLQTAINLITWITWIIVHILGKPRLIIDKESVTLVK